MNVIRLFIVVLTVIIYASSASASPAGGAIRETAEFILKRFGKGSAGQTVEEVTEATAKVIANHGEQALPFLRNSGHIGFSALKQAGENAPDVIRLHTKLGDDAIWVVSDPSKLAIFVKHGDSAVDALLKHPGTADSLIGQYGDAAVGALNNISRQSAQRLRMVAEDGLLTATPSGTELLPVIRQYGDEAMDFIWKNRGSLAVVAVIGTFLADPQAYVSGAKELIVSPLVEPMAKNTNWTLILVSVLVVTFLPFIARSVMKAREAMRARNTTL